MSDNWFYKRGGAIHGPVSAARLRALALAGGLSPEDLIWPQSAKVVAAVRADAALPFPSAAPAETTTSEPLPSLPAWISDLTDTGLDVLTLESLPPPSAVDWLADVRDLEQAPSPPGDRPTAPDGA
jgi:GYF domain 2